jgi:ureidoacrylate peracid hydrolase
VIDMQTAFCAPGGPAEVPASRDIVDPINALTAELRSLGVPVFWVLHANSRVGGRSDWELFFNTIVADDVREQTLDSLTAAKQTVWSALVTAPSDQTVLKNRYSALIPGSSPLERMLRGTGIDTILVAGTKTNVCCESTARDAMMLNFKTIMLTDGNAAVTDEDHNASLAGFYLIFGDVMSTDFAIDCLKRNAERGLAAAE